MPWTTFTSRKCSRDSELSKSTRKNSKRAMLMKTLPPSSWTSTEKGSNRWMLIWFSGKRRRKKPLKRSWRSDVNCENAKFMRTRNFLRAIWTRPRLISAANLTTKWIRFKIWSSQSRMRKSVCSELQAIWFRICSRWRQSRKRTTES